MNRTTPISQLNRVGKTTATRLKRLGLETAEDLLYYFPFRYEDFRQIVPIKQLRDGQTVTVQGRIELIANRRSLRKHKVITEALVNDDTGSIRVVWFNQPFLIKTLKPGDTVSLSGTVKGDMLGSQLVSPAYEKTSLQSSPSQGEEGQATHTARLVPIYPLTDGVTEKQLRFLVKQVLPLAETIPEWLPEKVLEELDLLPLEGALEGIHFPKDEIDLQKSTERLKFEELFLIQLQAEQARLKKQSFTAPELMFHEKEIKEFVERLPFQLTKAQKVAAWEILKNIAERTPMNRLLSGDVGSGKTVVAAMAMYNTALNGYQAVLMAPTEILAMQHFGSLSKLLGEKITSCLLTHSASTVYGLQTTDTTKSGKKKELLEKIQAGKVQVIVGTHALLSEGVDFKKLGLVIVDEQHRFGVEQRKVIKEKGSSIHFLSMTATPIPRSLALMLYGDLDVSIINEMPPGRKKIITRLVEPAKREKAYGFIREQVQMGRQVFVVCPVIEEESPLGRGRPQPGVGSTTLANPPLPRPSGDLRTSEKKSVLSEYEKLSKKIFPDLRVGYLHGKMKSAEKEDTMNKFSAKGGSAFGGKNSELDILVSTSVVEVGVDITNASVMMIEGADRFGLAQLHQFRGRVGRSEHQSYCLLFTDSDSSRVNERLRYFEQHHDGFKLAEKDLEMRGPGEVYGTEQSGMMQLRLAKLTDRDIIKKAREAAKEVASELGKYPELKERVREWRRVVHLE